MSLGFLLLLAACREHQPKYEPRDPHEVQASFAADHVYLNSRVLAFENIDSCLVFMKEGADPAYLERFLVFDAKGQMIRKQDFISADKEKYVYQLFEYNGDGQLTRRRSFNNEHELDSDNKLQYDGHGRLSRETFKWGSGNPSHIIHEYQGAKLVASTYASESERSHNRSYQYDSYGNLTSVITAGVEGNSQKVFMDYNRDNQLVKYRWKQRIGGSEVEYHYKYENNLEVLFEVFDKDGLSMLEKKYYDIRGLIRKVDFYYSIEKGDTSLGKSRYYTYQYTARGKK